MPFSAQDYDTEIGAIQSALQEAAGAEDAYRQKALDAQMKSAAAARENAMKIAQLQAKTQRYGIDVAAKTELENRLERAREFDASHGLEIAKAYTAFSSTPDLMFARNDFVNALGRVGQGNLPAPAMSQGQPHAQTWEDFAAIAQYNGSRVPGAPQGGGAAPQQQQGQGKDPRVAAASSIMKAIPPSETPGADGQDWAALEAIRQLYTAGQPGSVERLGKPRQKIALAGLARMGYDPAQVEDDYRRSRPGQVSPLLA